MQCGSPRTPSGCRPSHSQQACSCMDQTTIPAALTVPEEGQEDACRTRGRADKGASQHSGWVVHTAAEAVDPHGRAAAAQLHQHSAATGKRQSGQPLTDEAGCSITSRQRGRAGGRPREGSATRMAGGCKHGRNAQPAALHSSAPCNLQPHRHHSADSAAVRTHDGVERAERDAGGEGVVAGERDAGVLMDPRLHLQQRGRQRVRVMRYTVCSRGEVRVQWQLSGLRRLCCSSPGRTRAGSRPGRRPARG